MVRGVRAIDIGSLPELMQIAEEVEATGEARVLRMDNRDVAVVIPISSSPRLHRPNRRLSEKARQAFISASGGWADVDTERLLEDIYRARQVDDRPPVDL